MLRVLLLLIFCSSLSACYYMQAASGQWEVMRKRVPVDEVIAAPATSPELRDRLRLLAEAREFSIDVLHLPDNDSYRTYADLQRDHVVWNVMAAAEFSLQPKQWCFPVAGCVSYRGYFAEDKALKKSQQLARQGFDVAVGGVAAYSTLGKFSDPILNTMLRWDDLSLVGLLFHELAHQKLYVKDDTAFNESFASAVEEFGSAAWVEKKGIQAMASDAVGASEFEQNVSDAIGLARADLRAVYESGSDDETRRQQKHARFEALSSELHQLAVDDGRTLSAWYAGELNNAHLISNAVYEGYLPQFRKIHAACQQQFDCFYKTSERLSDLEASERERVLAKGDLSRFVSDVIGGSDDY